MDRPFTNVLIFGLYTKGKVRQERLDRKDIVEVSNPVVELIYLSYQYLVVDYPINSQQGKKLTPI